MSLQYVSPAARLSCLCVHFSEKFDSLFGRLDNRRMMHDSQNGALKWTRRNRKDTHYCSHVMLHWL
jgi:hypothetical protein